MNTKMLKKEFQNILTLEERAKHFYDHYIEQISDEKIKEKLISIRNDEIAHIKVAKRLIEMVS
ncbi:MAG: hypothetical protein HQ549_00165 [Candidatus Omnitrophica bacterium]|nr:hypothetical protein [Candidatus Omnitrophota bacterium]